MRQSCFDRKKDRCREGIGEKGCEKVLNPPHPEGQNLGSGDDFRMFSWYGLLEDTVLHDDNVVLSRQSNSERFDSRKGRDGERKRLVSSIEGKGETHGGVPT